MRTYWWANPGWVTVLLIIPLALAVATAPKSAYLAFDSTRQFYQGDMVVLAIVGLLAFAFGCAVMGFIDQGATRRQMAAPAEVRLAAGHFRFAMLVVGAVAFAGNFAVVAPVLANPGLVLAWLQGQVSVFASLKDMTLQLPGITSVSNVAALFATMFAVKHRFTGRRLDWLDYSVGAVVFVAVFLRSMINSERLALIEVIVPVGIVWFGTIGPRWRLWVSLAPILGVVGLIAFFAMTEYFRSWTFYRYYYDSYTDFVLERIYGYYLTALNNGAGLVDLYPPTLDFAQTMNWFYRFPLFPWVEAPPSSFLDFAFKFGSAEFNNTSGIYAPIQDVGVVAGVLMWFCLGLLSGWIYSGYRSGRVQLALLHPTWMIGVYEILRIFYWGSSKYFPTLVLTLTIVMVITRQRDVYTLPVHQDRAHPLAPVTAARDRPR